MKQQVTVKSLLVGYFVLLVTARQINFQCQNKLAFAQNARTGIEELQKSYDPSNGLYGNLWWNSANIVTMLADFQEYFPAFVNDITSTVFNTTLTMAPRSNNNNGFLNAYYDDELWWALAWIKVYDVTHDVKYLDTASSIFEDAKASWGTSPCGGLWWDKAHEADNAIENSLYLTTAAKLANRKPDGPSENYYLDEALKAYAWIISSGLINPQNLLNDGLLPYNASDPDSCKNNGKPTWSYNQGAPLSGLAEMTLSTGDGKYTDLAITIATAAINLLTDRHGILHDPCEPPCAGDGGQFKGVFARNVQFLVNRADTPAHSAALFRAFLQTNADSIWEKARNGSRLGPVWSGPYREATVQDQSSALDAIVGAACVS